MTVAITAAARPITTAVRLITAVDRSITMRRATVITAAWPRRGTAPAMVAAIAADSDLTLLGLTRRRASRRCLGGDEAPRDRARHRREAAEIAGQRVSSDRSEFPSDDAATNCRVGGAPRPQTTLRSGRKLL